MHPTFFPQFSIPSTFHVGHSVLLVPSTTPCTNSTKQIRPLNSSFLVFNRSNIYYDENYYDGCVLVYTITYDTTTTRLRSRAYFRNHWPILSSDFFPCFRTINHVRRPHSTQNSCTYDRKFPHTVRLALHTFIN